MFHTYLSERLSEQKGTEYRDRAAQARLVGSVEACGSGRPGTRWPRRVARSFAVAVLALCLLATACGEDTSANPAELDTPSPAVGPVVDRQTMLNQVLAGLARINGPYSASVAEPARVPPGLIGINGPYPTLSDARGAPDWLVDLNGPDTDEPAKAVPANVR